MAKILVALSGGVDSTIAAYRLKKQGHELIGCYMKLHGDEKTHEQSIQKVKKVADFLDIEYKILDLSEKFLDAVYNPFIQTYKDGRTPNPCVACNKNIKFGALIEYAKSLGVEKLATGHYVKIEDGFIREAKDKSKDQSYFLANVKKEAFSFMLFPLGDSLKEDVKKEAYEIEELNFAATQKESSEICFVENSYVDVLKEYVKVDNEGDVLDKSGKIVGKHRGYMHYTIGKRRGFEVRGAHEPHYVVGIDAKANTITVGDKEALNRYNVEIKDLNMYIDKNEFHACVKIRYRSPKTPCDVKIKNDRAFIELKAPVKGVASGQRAVFYDEDKVIGSGEII